MAEWALGGDMKLWSIRALALGTALATVLAVPSFGMSLRDAVQLSLTSNPEIGAAVQNQQAVEFELRQALGLYAPRVDLEGSVGVQRLDTPSRRAAGLDDDALVPAQIALVATFDLFDGGYRDAGVDRQAARIDSASFRVLERSEFIALQIARVYYQVVLQQRILGLSQENVRFHESMLQDVASSIESGQLTESDRLQVIERLAAAKARVTEAAVALEAARIEFELFVGSQPSSVGMPPHPGAALPRTLQAAMEVARINSPVARIAEADIDAAAALVRQAESAFAPKVQFEARGATGYDIGGSAGITNDFSARLSLRWNIFDGGVREAQVQEEIRRESEAMYNHAQAYREVDEAVKTSWLQLQTQGTLASTYRDQLNASANLIAAYREQFGVGERSLLDVLDAQNTRVNVQMLQETAAFGVSFAEYRLLAATGSLLRFMGLEAPSGAYARAAFNVEPGNVSDPADRKPLDLTFKP
ncbi:TolC family protein [Devosia riboflavina]|uniref:TolC family protein n=1 Tax=Devosia riboflavina TaxID=46914 RepID=UPI00068989FC|nr:TolC family protein [Devosia riboflavina]